jgi:UDP-N-acetylmuramyl-tripeptide synthetase
MKLFSPDVCPIAIINGDDEIGREIAQWREDVALMRRKDVQTIFYGLNTPSDAFALVTNETLRCTECILNIDDKLCRISLYLTGKHNVYNALAAAVCAMEFNVATEKIEEGLCSLKSISGRLERIEKLNELTIYVDFAHTPDGLGKSLDALRRHCKGRLVCLFGCGGNRDKKKRALMGEMAARKADFTILTSDNPRYEDPLDIISDIEKGYRRFSVKYVVVPERRKAIEYALDFLRKEDILLVAGKGGENYQEIMGIKYPFNDQDIIEKTLEGKGKKPLA